MVELLGRENFTVKNVPGKSLMVIENDIDGAQNGASDSNDVINAMGGTIIPTARKARVLHMVQGDLMDTPHIHCADIVMLETDFPVVLFYFADIIF